MTTETPSPTGFGVASSPFFFLGVLLSGRSLLPVGRMAVELGVLELAGAGVVEDREVALVDVFAQPRAAPLHLLVEDGAAQRAHEHDVFHVGRVKARGQQIDRDSDARLARADDGEIALKLMAVALGAGDAGGIVVIARQPAQLLRHEGGMGVVHAEHNGLFVAQFDTCPALPTGLRRWPWCDPACGCRARNWRSCSACHRGRYSRLRRRW